MIFFRLTYLEGFFGRTYDEVSELFLIVEATGFNNTLAGYDTCNNSNNAIGSIGSPVVAEWQGIYLAGALARFNSQLEGLNLTISDVYTLQQICSYEVCLVTCFCAIR